MLIAGIERIRICVSHRERSGWRQNWLPLPTRAEDQATVQGRRVFQQAVRRAVAQVVAVPVVCTSSHTCRFEGLYITASIMRSSAKGKWRSPRTTDERRLCTIAVSAAGRAVSEAERAGEEAGYKVAEEYWRGPAGTQMPAVYTVLSRCWQLYAKAIPDGFTQIGVIRDDRLGEIGVLVQDSETGEYGRLSRNTIRSLDPDVVGRALRRFRIETAERQARELAESIARDW